MWVVVTDGICDVMRAGCRAQYRGGRRATNARTSAWRPSPGWTALPAMLKACPHGMLGMHVQQPLFTVSDAILRTGRLSTGAVHYLFPSLAGVYAKCGMDVVNVA